jgi:hypothetical protein
MTGAAIRIAGCERGSREGDLDRSRVIKVVVVIID